MGPKVVSGAPVAALVTVPRSSARSGAAVCRSGAAVCRSGIAANLVLDRSMSGVLLLFLSLPGFPPARIDQIEGAALQPMAHNKIKFK